MTEPAPPCPRCGHADEDHRRESWFDEEGIEGMSCEKCEGHPLGESPCRWWTWDWAEVLSGAAHWEGDLEVVGDGR